MDSNGAHRSRALVQATNTKDKHRSQSRGHNSQTNLDATVKPKKHGKDPLEVNAGSSTTSSASSTTNGSHGSSTTNVSQGSSNTSDSQRSSNTSGSKGKKEKIENGENGKKKRPGMLSRVSTISMISSKSSEQKDMKDMEDKCVAVMVQYNRIKQQITMKYHTFNSGEADYEGLCQKIKDIDHEIKALQREQAALKNLLPDRLAKQEYMEEFLNELVAEGKNLDSSIDSYKEKLGANKIESLWKKANAKAKENRSQEELKRDAERDKRHQERVEKEKKQRKERAVLKNESGSDAEMLRQINARKKIAFRDGSSQNQGSSG
jgi:chromosome segregation ATPase